MNPKVFSLIVFLFLIELGVLAQGPNYRERHKQIEAEKIAFITRELTLTVFEAQQFWPVYNEIQQKQKALINRRVALSKRVNSADDMSGKEAEELADEIVKIRAEEATLITSHHEKLKKVLPPVKVVKFYMAEHQFKNYLLRQLRHRGGGNGGGRR